MSDKTISGRVIHGENYGEKLGFPTANIDRRGYGRSKPAFRFGVYGGSAQIAGSKKIYRSAIVIGPLDNRGLPKLEVHLLGFKGNLYGKRLTATLEKFIRVFKEYKNEEELVKQIKKDIASIKKLRRQGSNLRPID